VLKAYRLVYHSPLGSRVIKKKKKVHPAGAAVGAEVSADGEEEGEEEVEREECVM